MYGIAFSVLRLVARAGAPLSGEVHRVQDTNPKIDQATLFTYRPALDGLRAIAVVAVMLYHGAQLTRSPVVVFPGGFLGVDLFFVLSGYLITTLLLLEWRSTNTIRFRAFWMRRARRLLPALILVVTAVAIMFVLRNQLKFGASETSHYARDTLSSLFYVANWNFAYSGQSYFDQFGGPSPLRHMWSLAIEEQFYLVWPCLLFVLLQVLKLSRRMLAIVIMVGAWVSAIAMMLMFTPGQDPSRVYYGTDTRAQAMLIGAFVAVMLVGVDRERLRGPLVQVLGFGGLIGCFAMFSLASDDAASAGWMYQGGFAAMAIAAAFAIAAATAPEDTRYTAMLGWKPFVWIGTLSYGLYLWHWPIFVVLDTELTGLGGIPLLALRVAVTLGVSFVSYRFVEAPIRFGGLRQPRPRTIALAGAGVCTLLIAFGLVTIRPDSDDLAALGDDEIAALNITGGPEVHPGDLKVLLVGDSVAQSLGYYRGELPGYAVKTAAIIGCGVARGRLVFLNRPPSPAKPNCETWPALWKQQIRDFDPDVSVLMIGAWEVFNHEVDGQVLKVGTPEYEDYLRDELEQGLDILTAGGSPVVLLTSPCFKVLQPGAQSDWAERDDTTRVDWVNGVIRRFAEDHPGRVTLLDLHGYLCPEGSYVGEIDGVSLSNDGTHFTKAGAPVVWEWLTPQLDRFRRPE